MDVMIQKLTEREAQLMQAHREVLVERIARAMPEDGTAQPLPGLHFYRFSLSLKQVQGVGKPCVGVISQGCKEVLFGERRYRYDPSQYLLATIDLPHVSQVFEMGEQSGRLRHLAIQEGYPSHITQAVQRLRQDFD